MCNGALSARVSQRWGVYSEKAMDGGSFRGVSPWRGESLIIARFNHSLHAFFSILIGGMIVIYEGARHEWLKPSAKGSQRAEPAKSHEGVQGREVFEGRE